MATKPFDLEKAKAGAPVCNGDGRPARIVCFDAKGMIDGTPYPIVAMVIDDNGLEMAYRFTEKGLGHGSWDLRMATNDVTAWVNLYQKRGEAVCAGGALHLTEADAVAYGNMAGPGLQYIGSFPVTYEV